MGSRSADLRAEGFEVIFAYEEAIGFCIGDIVKDKDGIAAASVFVDMAKELQEEGLSCEQHLQRLYKEYGNFLSMNSYVKSPDPALTRRIFAAQRPEGKYCQKVADFAISDIRAFFDDACDR
ncbi:pgmB, partial [Symbiodinium pilosum]